VNQIAVQRYQAPKQIPPGFPAFEFGFALLPFDFPAKAKLLINYRCRRLRRVCVRDNTGLCTRLV
jgi:hypothetical protein